MGLQIRQIRICEKAMESDGFEIRHIPIVKCLSRRGQCAVVAVMVTSCHEALVMVTKCTCSLAAEGTLHSLSCHMYKLQTGSVCIGEVSFTWLCYVVA